MTQAESRAQMRPPKSLPRARCPYCGEGAELVDKSEVYKQSYGGRVWLCRPCDAWVMAHKDAPYRPTGTLAKSLLRSLRLKAQCLFDQVWKRAAREDSRWTENEWRHFAYLWLAAEMGIPVEGCQIAFLGHTATQCVIDICTSVGASRAAA